MKPEDMPRVTLTLSGHDVVHTQVEFPAGYVPPVGIVVVRFEAVAGSDAFKGVLPEAKAKGKGKA